MDRWPEPRRGPLSGVRVADFCWVGVGSIATRMLADFGAQVIKIEDRHHLDMLRRIPIYKDERKTFGEEEAAPDPNKGGMHNNTSRNKLGVTINMQSKEGRALAERLISTCSVVTENFAPGVMERWGLTYQRVQELRPDVIFARMSGFGHSGRDSSYKSYGPIVQAVCGMSFISGLPGREPSGWGLSYMDNQAAYYGSAAILMALFDRARRGRGSQIDLSAVEAGISMLGPILLDVAVNNRSTKNDDHFPTGNRLESPNAAPHGVYPCAGEDRWIAISVFDEDGWRGLVSAMGNPDWAKDDRFVTQTNRFREQDALDAHLREFTSTVDPYRLMEELQARGVSASTVQTAQDLSENDPQLAYRKLFFELDHPVIGPAKFEGVPMTFSRMAPHHWRSGPLLGEDNAYVFKEVLGLSDEEFDDLTDREII